MRAFLRTAGLTLALVQALCGTSSALTPPYQFITLNAPNTPINTQFFGINDATTAVGFFTDQSFVTHGVIYSGGLTGFNVSANYTPIDVPVRGEDGTFAIGINNPGTVSGFYLDSNDNSHAFLYTGGLAGPQVAANYITYNDPNSPSGTTGQGINDNGVVVGFYTDSQRAIHGFVYSGGTTGTGVAANYMTLDDPNGVNGTMAEGINKSGQIVGTFLRILIPAESPRSPRRRSRSMGGQLRAA